MVPLRKDFVQRGHDDAQVAEARLDQCEQRLAVLRVLALGIRGLENRHLCHQPAGAAGVELDRLRTRR